MESYLTAKLPLLPSVLPSLWPSNGFLSSSACVGEYARYCVTNQVNQLGRMTAHHEPRMSDMPQRVAKAESEERRTECGKLESGACRVLRLPSAK